MFRGIVIEGDECCKANTSGLISQIPSHNDVEHVFTSFKNDVGSPYFCAAGCAYVFRPCAVLQATANVFSM